MTEANITESKVNTIKTLIPQVEVCWRLILNELGRTIKRHVETCCLLIIQRFAAFLKTQRKIQLQITGQENSSSENFSLK